MKLRWYIAIAVIVFIGSLITQAPAATLYAWFKPKAPTSVQLFGLQGTVKHGQAAGLSINNRPLLNHLEWTLQPWRLSLGQVAFHLESRSENTIKSNLARSPFGVTRINDTQGVVGIKALLTAIGQPYLPLDGQADLQLKSVRLKGNQIRSADGRIEIHNLAWTLAQEPMLLGDLAANIRTENGTILVKIEPLSGALEITGTAKLSPDQKYEAQIQLRAKPNAPALVNNLLSSIGPADAQGWHHIRRQGQLQ